jgi:type VI secretion system protein ImpE
VTGTCDGHAFDDLRDLDDVCAPFLEVLTVTGKYYWIAMESIVELEFRAPARARDLVWRQTQMTVRDGPDGTVYVPALYPLSCNAADEATRLGRATDWLGGDDGPVRGAGQRMLLVGDEARPILELSNIEFADATERA